MAKLMIDTDKVKACGEDIKGIARDYCKIINELYTKIKNIEESGVWTSESYSGAAKKFVGNVLNDKESAALLGKDLENIGSKIIQYADNVNIICDNRL